jgi:excisionase family DNA binding protein
MSDLLDSTALATSVQPTEGAAHPSLSDLIGNRWSYQQIASALQCSERAVYMLIDKHRIPYVRVLSKRYVDPDAFRAALLSEQGNAPPRGRGRPRKAA